MLVSVSWLKKYVRIPVDTKTLAADLTMTGLNVERVENRGVSLEHVVVGRVLEKARHPNADRLSCCRVEVGPDDVRDIVCGAPNVAAGQLVPVALPGPNFRTDGDQAVEDPGIVSDGMICSEIELGIGEGCVGNHRSHRRSGARHAGAAILGGSDEILEIEVTPNRGDLLCHVGVAREAAAIYRTPLELPFGPVSEAPSGGKPDFEIEIEDPNDCARYVGRRMSGFGSDHRRVARKEPRVGGSPECQQCGRRL